MGGLVRHSPPWHRNDDAETLGTLSANTLWNPKPVGDMTRSCEDHYGSRGSESIADPLRHSLIPDQLRLIETLETLRLPVGMVRVMRL